MEKEQPIKIDIVKIQMVRDGTLDYGRKTIRSPQDLAELGREFIKNADREVFLLVSLDTKNHINCIHVVSIGTVNTALVSPREVLKVAILSNATSMAFIHNHPSGDVEPSEDDIKITNRVAECGDLFDIKLLDHVIVCDGGKYESFLEKGLIKKSESCLLRVTDKQKTQDEKVGTSCKDRVDFAQQHRQIAGYRKNCIKEGTVLHKLVRFKEFTELMRKRALKEIEKHSEAEVQKREAANIPEPLGNERNIHFALEDLVKKIIRFQNQRTEMDLIKVALWAYLLWMKLYRKQTRERRKDHGMANQGLYPYRSRGARSVCHQRRGGERHGIVKPHAT